MTVMWKSDWYILDLYCQSLVKVADQVSITIHGQCSDPIMQLAVSRKVHIVSNSIDLTAPPTSQPLKNRINNRLLLHNIQPPNPRRRNRAVLPSSIPKLFLNPTNNTLSILSLTWPHAP